MASAAFTVDTNIANVLLGLRNGRKRRKYAIANGINNTAKKVQAALRKDYREHFHVRKDFTLRQVAVISPFASAPQDRLLAVVSVGERKRLLLAEFEEGGPRTPFKGKRAAVPITGSAARPSAATSVPDSLQFKSLRLTRVRSIHAGPGGRHRQTPAGSGPQIKGQQRTFVLKRTAREPQGGVYQRIGSGPGAIRLLYAFVAGERIPKRLGWHRRAHAVAQVNLGPEVQKQVLETLKFHLGRAA